MLVHVTTVQAHAHARTHADTHAHTHAPVDQAKLGNVMKSSGSTGSGWLPC